MILKFSADWCGPCKQLSASLNRLGIAYKEVDIDLEPELTAVHRIRGVPTLVCDVTGNKRVGMMSDRELLEFVEASNEV